MSYDLSFWKKSDNQVTKNDIIKYLNDNPNIEEETGSQWIYQNQNTGVYFIIEFNSPNKEDGFEAKYFGDEEEIQKEPEAEYEEVELEDIEDFEEENFPGFDNTGFNFNINFIRPQFFGLEGFAWVEKFQNELDLFIINYQDEPEPAKYEFAEIFESWDKTNQWASKSNKTEFGLKSLNLEKSNKSWQHNSNREQLQAELGDDIFVPGIFYLRPKDDSDIRTVCVWPQHIPVILPEVDFVLVQREIKKLFFKKEEQGLVPFDTIKHQFKNFLERTEHGFLMKPKYYSTIRKIFLELKLGHLLEEYGEPLTADSFVNV